MPFRMQNGVRRAKAALLAGRTEIECEVVFANGQPSRVRMIRLEELRSPRMAIELHTRAQQQRFERLVLAVRLGVRLPPIEVSPGSSGVRLEDVAFDR